MNCNDFLLGQAIEALLNAERPCHGDARQPEWTVPAAYQQVSRFRFPDFQSEDTAAIPRIRFRPAVDAAAEAVQGAGAVNCRVPIVVVASSLQTPGKGTEPK